MNSHDLMLAAMSLVMFQLWNRTICIEAVRQYRQIHVNHLHTALCFSVHDKLLYHIVYSTINSLLRSIFLFSVITVAEVILFVNFIFW